MSVRERFFIRSPTTIDYWRGVVLFGRNVATYKFALAKALLELKPEAGTLLKLDDLAAPFSHHVCEHLKLADKQGTSASSQFLAACRMFNRGEISDTDLKATTIRLGFVNVVDAFHIVNQGEIPKRFFIDERKSHGGIRVTDEFAELLHHAGSADLAAEAEARWRLVETAWDLGVARHAVVVHADVELQQLFAADRMSRRVAIASCRSALNGYQKGRCFYCFRGIDVGPGTDIDHFFPRILKNRGVENRVDGVWNLVLACPSCNRGAQGKFSRVPSIVLLERLWLRNEFLIASHHPLRETLMLQTGADATQRRRFLRDVHQTALNSLFHTWEPRAEAADPYGRGELIG